MIERSLEKLTHQYLVPGKVVLIMGARRVGKTTLLKKVKNQAKEKVLYFNGDDIDTHELFAKRSVANFKRIIGDHKMLIFEVLYHLYILPLRQSFEI